MVALEHALEAGGDGQIRTAYTNLGLSNYAHKRYADAVICFEENILFITGRKAMHLLEENELTSLSFAYRLLALLYGEQGDQESAAAYNEKCADLEMDICLSCFNAEDAEGQPPDFAALRDQLIQDRCVCVGVYV